LSGPDTENSRPSVSTTVVTQRTVPESLVNILMTGSMSWCSLSLGRMKATYFGPYFFERRRAVRPSKPTPISASVVGSGTLRIVN